MSVVVAALIAIALPASCCWALGWALERAITYCNEHAIALSSDTVALIARGDKPGWDLGVYGSQIVIFRQPGAYGDLMKTQSSGIWLVGDPDRNGWRTGRRISATRLASIIHGAPTTTTHRTTPAPKDTT